jgi:AcrR family transcriptional regulator
MAVASLSAKEKILIAAERLFAWHGIDGASLRQIGSEAGAANNSAVQYHFGSKDQLVQAIVEYRLAGLIARRQELMTEIRPDDLRSWVQCQVTTVVEQAEKPDSHYMGFVSELWQYGPVRLRAHPEHLRAPVESFHARLRKLLTAIPEPFRTHRIFQAQMFIVHSAAQRERARDENIERFPLPIAIADLIDGMVGFLQAPASADPKAVRGYTSDLRLLPLFL